MQRAVFQSLILLTALTLGLGCGGAGSSGTGESSGNPLPVLGDASPGNLGAIPSVPGISYTIGGLQAVQIGSAPSQIASSLAATIGQSPLHSPTPPDIGEVHLKWRNLILILATPEAAALLAMPDCHLVAQDGTVLNPTIMDWIAGSKLIAANSVDGTDLRIDCDSGASQTFDNGLVEESPNSPMAWVMIVNGDMILALALPDEEVLAHFVMNLAPANGPVLIATAERMLMFGRPIFNLGPIPHWVQPSYFQRYLEQFIVPARFNNGALMRYPIHPRAPAPGEL